MELGPRIKGAARLPIEAVRVPVNITRNTVGHVGGYVLHAFDDTLDIFAPKLTAEQFVEERKAHHELDDAEIAESAIERGERNDDPELFFFGRAWLLRTMTRAFGSKDIPARITREVVHKVEVHGVLMPELEPMLPIEDVKPAKKAILKYGDIPVLEVFPNNSQDTV